jgi:hypothetical protein
MVLACFFKTTGPFSSLRIGVATVLIPGQWANAVIFAVMGGSPERVAERDFK